MHGAQTLRCEGNQATMYELQDQIMGLQEKKNSNVNHFFGESYDKYWTSY